MLAEFMYGRGLDTAGDKLMCQIRTMKDALGTDCITLVHQYKLDARLTKKQEFERVKK